MRCVVIQQPIFLAFMLYRTAALKPKASFTGGFIAVDKFSSAEIFVIL